jgi:4-aminobutyrate aminotransferase
MAAALATLDVLEARDLQQNAAAAGSRLLDGLRSALAGTPGVAEIRGAGLMIAVEFGDVAAQSADPDHARPTLRPMNAAHTACGPIQGSVT